jgi:hydrogenase expression/formation protein HypD
VGGDGTGEKDLAAEIVEEIRQVAARIRRRVRLMEVCGTHTVELRRQGIQSLLPESIHLISGPGCPVCVTPAGYIDNAIDVARTGSALVASFGDMLKVPGSAGATLASLAGRGHVKMVYSPAELVGLAAAASEPVVFLAIGFETTIPTVISALQAARDQGIDNLLLYTAFKTIVPALRFLLARKGTAVDAFLLPGHVSAIIGSDAYAFLSEPGGLPGVVTGFEPLDMLMGILLALRQVNAGTREVVNAYPRAVRPGGNEKALRLMAETLEPRSDLWRGLGRIDGGSLGLKPDLSRFDAEVHFSLPSPVDAEIPGCLCAKVITGEADPLQCALFSSRCTPEDPVGPCMVSAEGTCAAWLRYGQAQP